jgi:hypothetical protein
MSNAERQKRYRARHTGESAGDAPGGAAAPQKATAISKAEREEITRVIKKNEQAAKAAAARRAAHLLAEAERQLSARYKFDEEVWADITRAAKDQVDKADAEIARICRERGVPEEFRPGLSLGWYGRGENAIGARRAELRKLAKAKIDAIEADAVAAIELHSARALTKLVAGGLQSRDALAFLESLPTAEQLMPPLSVDALEGAATPLRVFDPTEV